MRLRSLALSTAGIIIAGMNIAFADQIDGDWCSADGQHLHIAGPNIKLPSGARITGDYNRHGFHYVGPAGDPEEGQDIRMSQQNDDLMYLQRRSNGTDGPPESWRRCNITS